MQIQRQHWEAVYSNSDIAQRDPDSAYWLTTMLEQAGTSIGGRVLELGCGQGYDTDYLVEVADRVTGLDLSWNALRRAAAVHGRAQFLQVSLHDSLPFRDNSFDCVVAGLCIHYFRWDATLQIIAEIRRVLGPGKTFVFRVNSTDDYAFGAQQGDEVEPGLWERDGYAKRFFSESDCRALFDDHWRLLALRPLTDGRYGVLKHTWAGVSRTR